jgi:ABC-type multidrug transport system fused ATPase/permease subunit
MDMSLRREPSRQPGTSNHDEADKPLLPKKNDIEQGSQSEPPSSAKVSFIDVYHQMIQLFFSAENKPPVMLAAFLSAIGVGLNIFTPYTLEKTIEALQERESDIRIPVIFMSIAYMLQKSIPIARALILAPVRARVNMALGLTLYDQFLVNTSLISHNNTPEANANFYFMRCDASSQLMLPLLSVVMPTLLEMFIATISLSSKFGRMIGVALTVLFVASIAYGAAMTPLIITAGESARQAGMKAWGELTGSVKNYKLIHDCSKCQYIKNELSKTMSKFSWSDINLQTKCSNVDAGLILLAHFIFSISLIQMDRIELTSQEAIVLITYLLQLTSQLTSLGQVTNQMLSAYPDVVLVTEKIKQSLEIKAQYLDSKFDLEAGAPSIKFDNIHFSFPPPGSSPVQALKGASLHISPGETVALFAWSGAGKSTFFNLLYGYYKPQHGAIMIDNKYISEYPPEEIQQHIGFVDQKPDLLDGTIRKNIAFGASDPTAVSDDEIKNVAEQAGLTDFIDGLHNKLDTDAHSLSGGQKQKVTILRALMKHTAVLLFDEATSAIDSTCANLILEKLSAMEDVTLVMTTHRMLEMKNYCDRIFVLDKGIVIDHGTHVDLLDRCALYRQSWEQYNKKEVAIEHPPPSPHTRHYGSEAPDLFVANR